jgi:hypothetical protein
VSDERHDRGSPISYLVLEPGTAVYAAEETEIGTVEHVLFVPEEDIFDGIVVQTPAGLRFVDASAVDRIYERCVITTLTAEQARELPPPKDAPPVFQVDPAEVTGHSLRGRLRRLFRKSGWSKQQQR